MASGVVGGWGARGGGGEGIFDQVFDQDQDGQDQDQDQDQDSQDQDSLL